MYDSGRGFVIFRMLELYFRVTVKGSGVRG
jgi:hypothetical protein